MSARRLSRAELRAREGGYAAVLVALLAAAVFVPITALSVDVARWYVELERVQTAADAAATAGVTYMPDDFASARTTAIAVAGRNGYPNSGSSTVTVTTTSKPSQIKVTVTSKIGNAFGSSIGLDFTTVSRSAVADFNGPAPMGSPCNAYGNEPVAANPWDANRGPNNSQIVAPTGGASCTSNPQFWAAIAGPDTAKGNGDAFMTRYCSNSAHSGCSGNVNSEFNPLGYFYIVRVAPSAVGVPMTIQIYDPAFVEVGDRCEHHNPSPSWAMRDWMNSWVPPTSPTGSGYVAPERYAGGNASPFCNGDVLNVAPPATVGSAAAAADAAAIVTSYGLRQPTDTYRPAQGVPITDCQRQYPGWDQTKTRQQALTSWDLATGGPSPVFKPDVAKVFRQWVDLCTYTPTQAGDHYLQIRTNVALGGTPDGEGGYRNNANVFSQAGDDTAVRGTGNNRFAIRVKGAARAGISVAGFQAMEMFANYAGAASTFNLVRVVPGAATKTVKIGFFDTGDALPGQSGTLTILPPTDSNLPASIPDCRAVGTVVTGTLSGCQLTNVRTETYNGKWQYVNVPIPANYTCNVTQAGGCWFRVRFAFPSGAPADTTTWTAKIDGDPVRLIE